MPIFAENISKALIQLKRKFHSILISLLCFLKLFVSDSNFQYVHVLNDKRISVAGMPVPAQSLFGIISAIQKRAECNRPKRESGTI